MSDPEFPPPPPPPVPPGQALPPIAKPPPHADHGMLPYRPPGVEPRSQWWTDQGAYSAAIIYGLMGLMLIGGCVSGIWWIIAQILGWNFWPF